MSDTAEWVLGAFVLFLIFVLVLASIFTWSTSCEPGYVWVDDERGRGCVPWEEAGQADALNWVHDMLAGGGRYPTDMVINLLGGGGDAA